MLVLNALVECLFFEIFDLFTDSDIKRDLVNSLEARIIA